MTMSIRPAVCIALAVLTGGLAPAVAARAQEKAPTAAPQPAADATGITVKGTGEVSVKPDITYVTVTVRSTGREMSEVALANARLSRKVVDAIKKGGITDKDIILRFASSNGGFGGGFGASGATTGTQEPQLDLSSTIRITVAKLEDAPKIMETAVEAGALGRMTLEFGASDMKKPRDAALKSAVEDAMSKAKAMADAAQVSRFRLVAMTEGFSFPQVTFPSFSFDFDRGALLSTGAVGVAAAALTANVTLRFEIVP